MKNALVVILCFLSLSFAACKEEKAPGNKVNATLPVVQYEQKMNEHADMQLIDVRTTEEYNAGHLKNARNINVNARDFQDQLNTLNKKKPVFVYCKSGGRSAAAATVMKEMGFAEIYNLDGGITQWTAAGKAVETGSAVSTSGMTMEDLQKLTHKGQYVLVDFNAKWCGPCKKMNPILESIASKKSNKLTLVKIDADENPVLLDEKKIEGIPYLELYKDGELVWKHEGFIEEEKILKETQL